MAQPWYSYPRVDKLGSPDPYGGFPKPDTNVQVPGGVPITALNSGVVSGINSPGGGMPPFGAVVTIRLDNPHNKLATHEAYLHLAAVPPGIHVGTRIRQGQILGYSGGAGGAAGSQSAPVGFALYSGDWYGYGQAWAQETYNNLTGQLNPVPVIQQAMAGPAPSTTGDPSIPHISGSPLTTRPIASPATRLTAHKVMGPSVPAQSALTRNARVPGYAPTVKGPPVPAQSALSRNARVAGYTPPAQPPQNAFIKTFQKLFGTTPEIRRTGSTYNVVTRPGGQPVNTNVTRYFPTGTTFSGSGRGTAYANIPGIGHKQLATRQAITTRGYGASPNTPVNRTTGTTTHVVSHTARGKQGSHPR